MELSDIIIQLLGHPVLNERSESRFQDVLRVASNIENTEERRLFVRQVVMEWAHEDYAATKEWLSGAAGGEDADFYRSLSDVLFSMEEEGRFNSQIK